MNEIFGVPMNSIMIVLLVMLAICLSVVLFIALRRPVMFKIGVRNIPRRPAETALVIVGLMLSTLIIAAALGTGDTIDYSATALTYETLGAADELVVYSNTGDGEGSIGTSLNDRIPQSTADEINLLFAGTGLVDGVTPILIETVPVFLFADGPPPANANYLELAQNGGITQSEPNAYLAGIDPAQLQGFGDITSVNGGTIDLATLADDEVVINEEMATKLGAEVGDAIGFTFENEPFVLIVSDVGTDSPLTGKFDANQPGMVIPLDRLQALTGHEGEVTTVAISNTGDERSGMALTDEVTTTLQTAFAGQPLGFDPIKQDAIEFSNLLSSVFTSFFLLFGLFSIGVGILLIILIFSMLAAERRPEMGMARAVGAQRAQLIQSFISEGTVYALVAGLVGAALGVGAAWVIAKAMNPIFGDFFEITPNVTPRSMVVAYSLGVVITFIAVVVSSWRISRLNIVAAVRDIPDIESPVRKRRTLVWAAAAMVIGGLLTVQGLNADSAFSAYLGMSMIPFGIGFILRYFGVSGRLIFSSIGVYLVAFWLLPDDVSTRIFGELNGDIEMFFLSGVFLVAGSTMLIVQNLDVLLWGLEQIGQLFKTSLPAVRTAVAFPSAAPMRTGMTIAMFSLIVFSLVVFTTINDNFVNLFLGDDANAGWDIRADQPQTNPIGTADDFVTLLDTRGVDTSEFEAVGAGSTDFEAKIRRTGGEWGTYFAHGIDDTLITESTLIFQARAAGFADDAAVVAELLSNPQAVVIDQGALSGNGGFGGAENQFVLSDPDGDGPQQAIESGDDGFDPIAIQLEGSDGQIVDLEIIGIIDSKVGSLIGLYGQEATIDQALPNAQIMSYFVRVSNPDDAVEIARSIESALVINGVQAVSINAELADQQQQNRAFLYIIQGFMGLGLLVGLAAVGVIAFRAVVERRQQIGVLRSIGFQPNMVSLSFLIESAFVVLLGSISGTALGVLLSRSLFSSEDFAPNGVDFIIPWESIIVILLITFLAALLMTVIPARQASKLAPAEALRYE